jgi:AAA+ superfamily predicted ATPase
MGTLREELDSMEEPAYIARIRLYARYRVLWLRNLWAANASDGQSVHQEIDILLADPVHQREAESEFYRTDPVATQMRSDLAQIDARCSVDPLLTTLQNAFNLSGMELDLLAAAVACEVSPELRKLYAYLRDESAPHRACIGLTADLFGWPAYANAIANGNLLRWRMVKLADPAESSSSLDAEWIADPVVVSYFQGLLRPDEDLAGYIQPAVPTSQPTNCLYPDQLQESALFARALIADRSDFDIALVGRAGSGKATLAAQICLSIEKPLLVADAIQLLVSDIDHSTSVDRILRVSRLQHLTGSVLYLSNADVITKKQWTALESNPGSLIYGSEVGLTTTRRGVPLRSFNIPDLSQEGRIALWGTLSSQPAPAIVAEWMLTPADIVAAAQASPAGPVAVAEACRRSRQTQSSALSAPLPCPYVKSDLVLSDHVRSHIDELETQARLRWSVYEEWGYQRLCPIGRGITALFSGPSGTGKTMAAQVLARTLDMDLYRVDLAAVVSKYIGETEKNLKSIFDTCDRANALLFFDEADALFGQRTQVKEAHDRFANIEIDYLLQRMEQFEGIAVLATNRKADLDQAFIRRIRFIIDFQAPGPAERLTLWQFALLPQSPKGKDLIGPINWKALAERVTMTGAEIKAAALGAAFMARAEESTIEMRHVVRSVKRELAKRGATLREADLA